MAHTMTWLVRAAGLALALVSLPPSAQAATESARCEAMVQDRVAWDAGNPNSTHWAQANLARLCGTSRPPEAMVACFQQQLNATQDWSTALETCVAEAAADTGTQVDVAEASESKLGTAYGDQGDTSDGEGYQYQQYVGSAGQDVAATGAVEDSRLTIDCMAALQDKVSQSPTDPDAKHWPEEDLRRLCQSKAQVRDTVACFSEIMGETKDRALAISSCSKLHPASDAALQENNPQAPLETPPSLPTWFGIKLNGEM